MKNSILVSIVILCLLGSSCNPLHSARGNPGSATTPTWQPSDNYCTVVSSVEPTLNPTDAALNALVPPVTSKDWTQGPSSAEVTFLEYIDFQCSGCAAFALILDQLRMDFPNDTRIVVRYFPNPAHDKSLLAAQAAEAAGLQGKFWEMKSALLDKQVDWLTLTNQDFSNRLNQTAIEIGLDSKQFQIDLASQLVVDAVTTAQQEGMELGIPYLPFLVINGRIWQGPWDYSSLKQVVNLMLLEGRQFTGCPPFSIDTTKQYIASIETEKGTIVIQLYADKAPYAVNSFNFLAGRGFYDGITFHRVIQGILAQSGDPSGTGYGGPGYAYINEIDPSLKYDRAGVVGMANIGPDTNGSQFFITMTAMPNLDGLYTIFGQVIQGMNVVQSLSERDSSQGLPLTPGDKIIHVTVEEK